MKIFLSRSFSAMLAIALITLSACEDDEQIFDAPTIAVVSDITEPYPGDKVTYTINVTAPGKLNEVFLNNVSIKTYSTDQTEDSFTYEYTVPANETLGPKTLTFRVTDKQGAVKEGQTTGSLTVLNPDFRGSPVVLYDFQAAAIPNSQVRSIVRDIGGQPWENAYDIFLDATDPEAPSNRVLRADRKGAHEWYFQGGGAIKIRFERAIAEDEIEKIVSGERVLQMNMYFKEVPRLITAHKSPDNPDATKQDNVNLSWLFDYTKDARVPNVPEVWDFVAQDSVRGGIPIIIEMGQFSTWEWNNGFMKGKKFYLVGSIQQKNGWQTVTFSRRIGTITAQNNAWRYENFVPGTQASTAPAALHDPQVGLDQIDYMSIIINARLTGFSNQLLNTSPWYEMPGDGNGWVSNRIAGISDDHNTYYIDNIRVIDAVDYDKNPNN